MENNEGKKREVKNISEGLKFKVSTVYQKSLEERKGKRKDEEIRRKKRMRRRKRMIKREKEEKGKKKMAI